MEGDDALTRKETILQNAEDESRGRWYPGVRMKGSKRKFLVEVANTRSLGKRYARGGSSSFAVPAGLTEHKVTDRETNARQLPGTSTNTGLLGRDLPWNRWYSKRLWLSQLCCQLLQNFPVHQSQFCEAIK